MNLTALLPHFSWPTFPAFPTRRAQPRTATTAARPAAEPQALQRHATLRLPDRPLRLQLLQGCVWITRDGCAADWVLEAGQCFEQGPGAPVLVHALEDARLALVMADNGTQNGC